MHKYLSKDVDHPPILSGDDSLTVGEFEMVRATRDDAEHIE